MNEAINTVVQATTTNNPIAQYLWIGLIFLALIIGVILILTGKLSEIGKVKFNRSKTQITAKHKLIIDESNNYINNLGLAFMRKIQELNPDVDEFRIYKLAIRLREALQYFVLINNMDDTDAYINWRWTYITNILESDNLKYDEDEVKKVFVNFVKYVVHLKKQNEI